MAQENKGHVQVVGTFFNMGESEPMPKYVLADGSVLECRKWVGLQGVDHHYVVSDSYTAQLEKGWTEVSYGYARDVTKVIIKKDGEQVMDFTF